MANLAVAIVTFDGPMAANYVEQTGLHWPLLIDANREMYHHYGMAHGSRWSIFGPSSIWKYVKLLLSGKRLEKSGSDYLQLGGDVLIAPDGTVRFHYVTTSPHDRPDVTQILKRMDS